MLDVEVTGYHTAHAGQGRCCSLAQRVLYGVSLWCQGNIGDCMVQIPRNTRANEDSQYSPRNTISPSSVRWFDDGGVEELCTDFSIPPVQETDIIAIPRIAVIRVVVADHKYHVCFV